MKLNSEEFKSVLTIGTIVATRLLGIFLILPVFSIYTLEYPKSTLTLAGIAFGIYALAQSLLQIPFGWTSDRIGRKRVLIFGLMLFSLGSLVCGFADNIYELIFARIFQGSGAVGSVAIASLGDTTRPNVRAQAFTITGIIVGIAFIVSLVCGPIIATKLGFKSLFFILAGLGILAILITILIFPKIDVPVETKDKSFLLNILKNKDLKSLLTAAFVISFALNLFLFIYPLNWKLINLDESRLWLIYLIIILPSALFVFPYMRSAERKGKLKNSTYIGFLFLIFSLFIFLLGNTKFILLVAGALFFIGHTIFQSILPAYLTQRVPSEGRGTSSGFYNLANFFGASVGGMSAGYLYSLGNYYPILISIIFLIIWIVLGLPKQPDQKTIN